MATPATRSTPEAALPHRAYAGLVSRLAALSVDVALVSVAAIAVRMLPGIVWEEVLGRAVPDWLDTAAGVAALVLPWAYFTVSWWLTDQTVGDLILGLAVLRHDGGELSMPHAGLRAAIGLALAPLWMIGLLTVLWDGQRRALHDMVFHTVVRYVRRRDRSGPA